MKTKKVQFTIVRAILVAALICLTFGMAGNVALAYTNTWGVVDDGAKIRSKPTTSSEAISSIAAGGRIEICGKVKGSDEGDEHIWYKVVVSGNQTGYIRGDLITDTGEATGNTSADSDNYVVEETPQETEETPQEVEVIDTSASDATLHSLSISEGTMSPDFDPNVTAYTIEVGENTNTISVFGVPNTDAGASVIDNSGFSDLEMGKNYGVITVQAADGTTISYTFTVIRGELPEEENAGDESADTQSSTTTGKQTSGGHAAIVVILVIVILLMGGVIAVLVLQNMNLRKMLGGSGYRGSGLPDFKRLFSSITDRFSKGDDENHTVYKRRDPVKLKSLNKKPSISEDEDEEFYEPEEDFDGGYSKSGQASYGYDDRNDASYSYSGQSGSGIQDPGMKYASVEDALNSIKSVTAPTRNPAQEAYDMRLQGGDVQPDQGAPTEGYDLDDEEDEIEDILERNATITESQKSDAWKPENFLTPRDDLEFEFLDIDDEDE